MSLFEQASLDRQDPEQVVSSEREWREQRLHAVDPPGAIVVPGIAPDAAFALAAPDVESYYESLARVVAVAGSGSVD